jgi:hypothetical protein
MAKRNTDTDKWKKPFIRSLSADYKLLWLYIIDDCDHAGIWHVDFEVARIRIGCPKITEEKAQQLFSEKIKVFGDEGSKWYIADFVVFQYGNNLSEKNRLHMAVKGLLVKYGLMPLNASNGVETPENPLNQAPKSNIHTQCMEIYHIWFF